MRAISPFARYSITLESPPVKRGVDKTGAIVEYSDGEPIIAQFEVSGLTKQEELVAIEVFDGTLRALPGGVHPLTRVSVFDTDLFTVQMCKNPADRDAFQEKVDTQLRSLQAQYPTQFVIVDLPKAGKPWHSYDEAKDVDSILELMTATGTDTQTVRRYEQENAKRADVLDALDALDKLASEALDGESITVAL